MEPTVKSSGKPRFKLLIVAVAFAAGCSWLGADDRREEVFRGGASDVRPDGSPMGGESICHQYFEGMEFIRSGALGGTDAGILVSGLKVDGRSWPGPYSPDEFTQPWLFAMDDGLVDLPFDEERAARIVSLAPVGGPEGEWSLVWGEAAPPDTWSGPWPRYMSSELWKADRQGSGWTAPSLLAQTGHVDWEFGRTLRYAGDGTPFVMVGTVEDSHPVGTGPMLFGRVSDSLSVIRPHEGLAPIVGSFSLDPTGTIEAIVLAQSDEGGVRSVHATHTTSIDNGYSWTEPEVLASWPRTRSLPSGLRVHFDRDGTLHAMWSASNAGARRGSSIRHMFRNPDTLEWQDVLDFHVDSATLRWVSGIDRAGVLTLVEEILRPSEHALSGLRVRRWQLEEGWAEPLPWNPGEQAGYLFDGQSVDGVWHIGWIGMHPPVPGGIRGKHHAFTLCVGTP
jgi:hypothetical protein